MVGVPSQAAERKPDTVLRVATYHLQDKQPEASAIPRCIACGKDTCPGACFGVWNEE